MNAAPKNKPTPPRDAAVPDVPPTPPRVRTLAEVSPDFAAVALKFVRLNNDLSEARSELEQLQALLGTTETNPIRMEALELLGENKPGAAADLAEKHARLKTARSRFAVLTEAVRLLQPTFETARHAAWRQLMQEATPTWRALLAVHSISVVAAARSRLEVVKFCDSVLAVSPPGAGGLGDYAYPMGDARDHSSPVSLWIGELVGIGVLQGSETWLENLPFLARKPDGTAVDRASPPTVYNQESPAPAKGKSVLGAVGAAVRQGAAAVASAFTPPQRTPNDQALPYPAARVGSTGPAADGPTKEITLHRSFSTSREEYPTGWTGQWPATDAANLVARGYASWGAAPASPPALLSDVPVSAAATLEA